VIKADNKEWEGKRGPHFFRLGPFKLALQRLIPKGHIVIKKANGEKNAVPTRNTKIKEGGI